MFRLLWPSEQRICPKTPCIAVTGKISDGKYTDGLCDLDPRDPRVVLFTITSYPTCYLSSNDS